MSCRINNEIDDYLDKQDELDAQVEEILKQFDKDVKDIGAKLEYEIGIVNGRISSLGADYCVYDLALRAVFGIEIIEGLMKQNTILRSELESEIKRIENEIEEMK